MRRPGCVVWAQPSVITSVLRKKRTFLRPPAGLAQVRAAVTMEAESWGDDAPNQEPAGGGGGGRAALPGLALAQWLRGFRTSGLRSCEGGFLLL